MSDPSDSAKYIKVSKSTVPGTRRNSCSGCGTYLDPDKIKYHSVEDCLKVLRVLINEKADKHHTHSDYYES